MILWKISITFLETYIIWENPDSKFDRVSKKMCHTSLITGIVSRQQYRNNKTLASTPEEYFQAAIGAILLGKIVNEMGSRFNPSNMMVSELLLLMQSIINEKRNIDVDEMNKCRWDKISGNSHFLQRSFDTYVILTF